jgi:hypothetical protein
MRLSSGKSSELFRSFRDIRWVKRVSCTCLHIASEIVS